MRDNKSERMREGTIPGFFCGLRVCGGAAVKQWSNERERERNERDTSERDLKECKHTPPCAFFQISLQPINKRKKDKIK